MSSTALIEPYEGSHLVFAALTLHVTNDNRRNRSCNSPLVLDGSSCGVSLGCSGLLGGVGTFERIVRLEVPSPVALASSCHRGTVSLCSDNTILAGGLCPRKVIRKRAGVAKSRSLTYPRSFRDRVSTCAQHANITFSRDRSSLMKISSSSGKPVSARVSSTCG